jgi:hypothetical protein
MGVLDVVATRYAKVCSMSNTNTIEARFPERLVLRVPEGFGELLPIMNAAGNLLRRLAPATRTAHN